MSPAPERRSLREELAYILDQTQVAALGEYDRDTLLARLQDFCTALVRNERRRTGVPSEFDFTVATEVYSAPRRRSTDK